MSEGLEKLQPATFRGVPFKVARVETTGGRRVIVHEYPQRDRPYIEDTGRLPRRWRVDAYVIGSDWQAQRDRLRAICERPPLGYPFRIRNTLVLPQYGRLHVACEECTCTEESNALRMARFSLTFVESGEDPGRLEGRTDSATGVDAQATAILSTAGAELEDGLADAGYPEQVREATEAELEGFGAKLKAARGMLSGAAESVQELEAGITRMLDNAADLATAPADLVVTVSQAVSNVRAAATNALEALRVYEQLYGITPTLTGGSSSTAAAADGNATLTVGLIASGMVAGAAQSAARAAWTSEEEAVGARTTILAELDRLELTATDGVFRELERLRALVVGSVPRPGEELPRLGTLTLPASMPGPVVGWRYFGDRDEGEAIAERNRLPLPGLLPGGVELEVLVRD